MYKIINKKIVYFFIVLFICIIYSPYKSAFADDTENGQPNIILLNACDEEKDDYPVYEEMGDSESFNEIYNNTFLKQSFSLYKDATKYSDLEDKNIYIASRKNSGCYGGIGFYLKKDGEYIDKTNSAFIELKPTDITGDYKRLDSITQILPHEMGHVIYEIITGVREFKTMPMDMHYSDIVTEYTLAFQEGFGEHFQVIAREYETNEDVENAINKDLELQRIRTEKPMNKLERDFKYKMRLDFYRELSPFIQSKYESIKRNDLATTNNCIYKNKTHDFIDTEKTILYRNMGFEKDKNETKSLEQSISTESVVSNFFVNFINSSEGSLNERYSKIFNVFSKDFKNNAKPNLIEFVNGYIKEYPQEKSWVEQIFKESTGHEFKSSCLDEIWCFVDGSHSRIIFDQFNGINCNVYTFNLNTCEKADLMKIKEIKEKDAEKIIEYRQSIGGFKSRGDIKSIKDVDSSIIDVLYKNSDIDTVNAKINNDHDENNIIIGIVKGNVKHLIFKTFLWILILCILSGLYYFKVIKYCKKQTAKSMVRVSLKFIFYVILGLFCSFVQGAVIIHNRSIDSVVIYVGIALIIELVTLWVLRHKREKQIRSIREFLVLSAVVVYSLV